MFCSAADSLTRKRKEQGGMAFFSDVSIPHAASEICLLRPRYACCDLCMHVCSGDQT